MIPFDASRQKPPYTGLDTDYFQKVAVRMQKQERPESDSGLPLVYLISASALNIELFRMQRCIALYQDVFPGQLLELHQPARVV